MVKAACRRCVLPRTRAIWITSLSQIFRVWSSCVKIWCTIDSVRPNIHAIIQTTHQMIRNLKNSYFSHILWRSWTWWHTACCSSSISSLLPLKALCHLNTWNLDKYVFPLAPYYMGIFWIANLFSYTQNHIVYFCSTVYINLWKFNSNCKHVSASWVIHALQKLKDK